MGSDRMVTDAMLDAARAVTTIRCEHVAAILAAALRAASPAGAGTTGDEHTRKILAAATPRPWGAIESNARSRLVHVETGEGNPGPQGEPICTMTGGTREQRNANAELITIAVNAFSAGTPADAGITRDEETGMRTPELIAVAIATLTDFARAHFEPYTEAGVADQKVEEEIVNVGQALSLIRAYTAAGTPERDGRAATPPQGERTTLPEVERAIEVIGPRILDFRPGHLDEEREAMRAVLDDFAAARSLAGGVLYRGFAPESRPWDVGPHPTGHPNGLPLVPVIVSRRGQP